MYYDRDELWNLRDTHMFQTLIRIMKHRGEDCKAIVWAHNSHVGDARGTSMGWSREEVNIGQLCRETFGNRALSIGCLGHTGTVAAAQRWGGNMRVMLINLSLPGRYEELMHTVGFSSFVLDLRKGSCDENLREALMRKRLERFIGVIYRPDTERHLHYSEALLPELRLAPTVKARHRIVRSGRQRLHILAQYGEGLIQETGCGTALGSLDITCGETIAGGDTQQRGSCPYWSAGDDNDRAGV